ncbi:hypothetical protein F4604DRAFT_1683004 [Suillus subluteus]|nr:hypothetical protein F4604DRAFT_1683004 [Suillus subluteus]
MSHSNSNSGSAAPSPEAQSHISPMDRPDSPRNIDFNANHENDRLLCTSLQQNIDDNHHRNSESLFSHGGVQSMYNTSNNFHLLPEYFSDDISLKQSIAGGKPPNNYGAGLLRSSLSAYNGISGGNAFSTGATGSYRLHQPDGLPSQPYSNTNEIFGSHQPLNLQHQLSQQCQQSASSNSGSQMPYLNGIRLQSQTPYGPHLQSNGGAAAVSASNIRPMGSVGQMNLNVESQSVNNGLPQETSTIFVVGFPDDMQEREFQNMFTFSSGFEAATLKIPNKEYTVYSPTTSWPPLAMPLDEPSHFQVGQGLGGQSPQKQIIGFAKFRTRQEALEARDLPQGRRVDIEKGAILKAKMAKKNLHIKLGVGMGGTASRGGRSVSLGSGMGNIGGLSGSGAMGSLSGLGSNADIIANLASLGLNNNLNLNNLAAFTSNNSDILSPRERELNSAGLDGSGWRLEDSSDDVQENIIRDRRREALDLGLGLMRDAHEHAQTDEEEGVRRSKHLRQFQADASRMLPENTPAFEAFHSVSVPALSRHSQSGCWDAPSPHEREASGIPQTLSSLYAARKSLMISVRPPSPHYESPPLSHAAFSPSDEDDMMLPPYHSGALRSLYPLSSQLEGSLHLQRQSQSMAPGSAKSSSARGFKGDRPVLFAVSTSAQPSSGSAGIGSPQLASPSSQSGSASSSTGMNGGGSATSAGNAVGAGPRNVVVDQNPPINILYVSNLPTGSVATKALNELYGDTLGGIVKNDGICLSHSKNPLSI